MDRSKIIFTGGGGLLGQEFQKVEPEILCPTSKEFDVTNYERMQMYAEGAGCEMIIHAAADTNVSGIESNPTKALEVNIIGTANIVKLCEYLQIDLIYISTDYVFRGDRGGYKEDDELHPVNKYAWSKLGGECAVQLYNRSLIIRTSFGPKKFPYKKAFIDQWTSRIPVDLFARHLSVIIDRDYKGILHVGGPGETVFEYAKFLNPDEEFGEISINDIDLPLPTDTSLNCEKFVEGTLTYFLTKDK